MKLRIWTALAAIFNALTGVFYTVAIATSNAAFACKSRAAFANLDKLVEANRSRS